MRTKVGAFLALGHIVIVASGSSLIPDAWLPKRGLDFIATYSAWTGGGHGYSFFSPNVGYQCVANAYFVDTRGVMQVEAYGGDSSELQRRVASFIHSCHNARSYEIAARSAALHCLRHHHGEMKRPRVTVVIAQYIPAHPASGEPARYAPLYEATYSFPE